MKEIYSVSNKVFHLFFETRKDAEAFASENATISNGLTIYVVPVIPNSEIAS